MALVKTNKGRIIEKYSGGLDPDEYVVEELKDDSGNIFDKTWWDVRFGKGAPSRAIASSSEYITGNPDIKQDPHYGDPNWMADPNNPGVMTEKSNVDPVYGGTKGQDSGTTATTEVTGKSGMTKEE